MYLYNSHNFIFFNHLKLKCKNKHPLNLCLNLHLKTLNVYSIESFQKHAFGFIGMYDNLYTNVLCVCLEPPPTIPQLVSISTRNSSFHVNMGFE